MRVVSPRLTGHFHSIVCPTRMGFCYAAPSSQCLDRCVDVADVAWIRHDKCDTRGHR